MSRILVPIRMGYVTGRRVFFDGLGYVTIVGGVSYAGYEAVSGDD